MVQFFGRILRVSKSRLVFKTYVWDRKLNESGAVSTWSSEIKSILYDNNLGHVYDSNKIFTIKPIVSELTKAMQVNQKLYLKTECFLKPKLRTFITFKDFDSLAPHIGKPLSFVERRMVSKLRLGILPIRIETARYERPVPPEEERTCYCGSQEVESESHVLFDCMVYHDQRVEWLKKLCTPGEFDSLPIREKFKIILNNPDNVRPTAKYLVNIMDFRSLQLKTY